MMGEEVAEVILESYLPSLHSSTAFINLGDPAVKFLCQQFQKINILFVTSIHQSRSFYGNSYWFFWIEIIQPFLYLEGASKFKMHLTASLK